MIGTRPKTRSTNTENTLKKVSEKLSFIIRTSSCIVNQDMEIEVNRSETPGYASCRQYAIEIIKKRNIEPNGSSRLMAAIHFIVTRRFNFLPYTKETNPVSWPCKPVYEGEIVQYKLAGNTIDISILEERKNDSPTESCFLVLNFIENPFAYHYEKLDKSIFPTFLDTEENATNDAANLFILTRIISVIVAGFILDVVQAKKYKGVEFNQYGVTPWFPQENPAKRMRMDIASSNIVICEDYLPEYYTNLVEKFSLMSIKPTEISCLFALVIDIIINQYNCKCVIDRDVWPGSSNYKNNIVEITFWFASNNTNLKHTINFSLMFNGQDFYACFRVKYINTEHICFKKIVKSLVPTYLKNDIELERYRILNLTNWLTGVFEQCIFRVITGTYKPKRLSKSESSAVSSVISSLSSSQSTSRDE